MPVENSALLLDESLQLVVLCAEIPHIQGQRSPSKTVGAGAVPVLCLVSLRRCPTSKGKEEATARRQKGQNRI